MTKKMHKCDESCKIITGTPRPYIYCLVCNKDYIDFCIKGHWEFELKYDTNYR